MTQRDASGPDPPDGELVARAREGDAAGFDALVRRHYRSALAVAMAITGRRDDAEDVCQDAWIRALEKLDECRQPDRFVYWLLQIVRNRARNFLDYRRVRRTETLESVESEASGPGAQAARLKLRLEEAMRALSETQREIVLLHDLEGWDHRSIAENLGMSEVMSRQHLFQARRRLRDKLRDVEEVRSE